MIFYNYVIAKKKMQWNNSLPDKTLSVSNEGMNAKKVKKIKFHSTEQMDKSVYINYNYYMDNSYGHAIYISVITTKLNIFT